MRDSGSPFSQGKVWFSLRLGFLLIIGVILLSLLSSEGSDTYIAFGFWFAAALIDFLTILLPQHYRTTVSILRFIAYLCGLLFMVIIFMQLMGISIIERLVP
jgi:hypothetical protein